jgi:hypothetical protein
MKRARHGIAVRGLAECENSHLSQWHTGIKDVGKASGSDETIFRIDEKLWKRSDAYAVANKQYGWRHGYLSSLPGSL